MLNVNVILSDCSLQDTFVFETNSSYLTDGSSLSAVMVYCYCSQNRQEHKTITCMEEIHNLHRDEGKMVLTQAYMEVQSDSSPVKIR